MKKYAFRNPGKQLKTLAVALLTGFVSFGQPINIKDPAENPVVKYISSDAEHLVFQVQLDNETGKKFSVSIKDQNGTILFKNIYNDKKFDKKFLLDRSDENGKLIFIIRTLDNDLSQTFEVNTYTRIYQDVVVSKVN